MNYLKIILIFILLIVPSLSNENIPVKYIDLNYIVNESNVGKKIKEKILSDGEKLKIDHKKLESKLEAKKDEILGKKNILSKEDFEKEVNKHQKNVKDYHAKQKKDLDKLGKRNLEMSKNFMTKIDEIIMNYAKENSIDLLLKRETLIVSNSKLDITKDILTEVNNKIKKID
jgi:outer membrane protein|tara:strand:+ start:2325 stop:2840 length:516 start_codon:yes stop_codon:yes gene_type:complete